MIQEIFLPERIGSRRIIPQRIISITLQDDAIYAVRVHAKRAHTIVEEVFSASYEAGNQESLVIALTELKQRFGTYDRITVSLPASVVVIKELELPFIDIEKIRMVLDYEIEPMLPFSIDDAVIDFIVVESSASLGTSQILAAAVRVQDLQNALDMYARAGIDPSIVSVDLFSLYSLYQQIPDYQTIKNGSAFVDLGLFTTRISFLQNGKLRMTRQIPRGLMTMVNAIAKESSKAPEDILAAIKTSGISNVYGQGEDVAVQKQMINFFNDIQFTLNSFSLKANYYEGITKILFVGKAVEITEFMKFSSNVLQIPCEIFDVQKFFDNKYIKKHVAQEPALWSHYAAALGAGVSSPTLLDFTLRRKAFTPTHQHILIRQVIAAGVLAFLVIGGIAGIGYMQISTLKKQIAVTEAEYMKKLLPLLPAKDRAKKKSLQALVSQAKKTVKEKEELFAPIMQERTNVLQLLFECTEMIDKKRTKVTIDEIIIEEIPQTPGQKTIEVNGYFQSPDLWKDWGKVKERFKESPFLELVEDVDDSPAAEKGAKFKAKLKLKAVSDKEA